MRKYVLSFSTAACIMLTAGAQDTEKPRIEGSGNTVTKEFPVTSFDQLDVNGVFSVQLTQGNKEEVKIEAEDNLQQLFDVKNEGSKLIVGMKKDQNFNSKKKMKVYITFKRLKSMDLKTVGDITSDQNMNFDDLKISNKSVGAIDLKVTVQHFDLDNKSVGTVKLNGKADNAVIKNKGVGSLHAADLLVQTMDIENSGIGSAEVNAAKELKVRDNGMSRVTNKGSAPVKRANKMII